MKSNGNRNKDEFLGMSYGTATGRLKKSILFSLLVRFNLNKCYRCEQPILEAKDLSIEHIKPWLGVSVDLFWDLENISFSHLSCNCSHHNYVKPIIPPSEYRKIKEPEGKGWCNSCKIFVDKKKFTSNKSRYNGLQNQCSLCRSSNRAK